jgi:acetylornithine deacetylase
MTGALTFPPNEDLRDIHRELAAAVQQACERDPWLSEHPAQLDWLQGISGVEVAEDSAIYETVADAIQTVTGITPQVQSLHAASEIRTPILYSGIPTVGFGPLCGDNVQSGGSDEWVSVDDFINMIEVVATVVAAWCR